MGKSNPEQPIIPAVEVKASKEKEEVEPKKVEEIKKKSIPAKVEAKIEEVAKEIVTKVTKTVAGSKHEVTDTRYHGGEHVDPSKLP